MWLVLLEWAALAVEDGKKVVYARCMLGESSLSVVAKPSGTHIHNAQKGLTLTARLVLNYTPHN